MKPYIDIATMTKSDAQAYRYLKTYGAITNINKHYGALHKL